MTEKLLKNHAERGSAQSTHLPADALGALTGHKGLVLGSAIQVCSPWLGVVAWGRPGLPPALPVTHGLEQRLTLPMRNAWDARSAHCLVNAGLLAACPRRRRNFCCSLVTLPITDRMQ